MNFISKALNKLFKSGNQQELNKIKPIISKINNLEKDFLNFASEDFARKTSGEEAVTQSLVMKEWIPPSELGDLVTYLSGGSCRHLTGATLDVNGASYLR